MRFETAIPVERLTMRPLSGAEVEALVREQVVGRHRPRASWSQQIQVRVGRQRALRHPAAPRAAAAAGELPDSVPVRASTRCAGRGSPPPRREDASSSTRPRCSGPMCRSRLLAAILDTYRGRRRAPGRRAAARPACWRDRRRPRPRPLQPRGDPPASSTTTSPPARRRRLHERVRRRAAAAAEPRRRPPGGPGPPPRAQAGPLVSDDRVAAALEAAGRHAARQGALGGEPAAARGGLALASRPASAASIDIARSAWSRWPRATWPA